LAAFDPQGIFSFMAEESMEQIPAREVERAMKVQEVILRAL
jgi:hypothetical protein